MTQNAYMLNTTIDDMYAHQAACQLLGGHLVSYTSLQEQQEVEELFVSQGVLLPAYHLRYWLGLYIPYRDPKLWPGFLWHDGSHAPTTHAKPLDTYGHWGLWEDLSGVERQEPNNAFPPEFCAVANFSQVHEQAWGWSDQNCEGLYIAICKFAAPPPPAPRPPPPSPPPPQPPLDPVYVSPTSGSTFHFEGAPATYRQAQLACQAMGPDGRLVAYLSKGQQVEVEGAYSKLGWLRGGFVSFYWIGLEVPFYNSWPQFVWSTGLAAKDVAYSHWGEWLLMLLMLYSSSVQRCRTGSTSPPTDHAPPP